jgi:hypothetical protein
MEQLADRGPLSVKMWSTRSQYQWHALMPDAFSKLFDADNIDSWERELDKIDLDELLSGESYPDTRELSAAVQHSFSSAGMSDLVSDAVSQAGSVEAASYIDDSLAPLPSFEVQADIPSTVHSTSTPMILEASEEELAACGKRDRDALEKWYVNANALHTYVQIHGDANVPQTKPEGEIEGEGWTKPLAVFVNKNRMKKRAIDAGKKDKLLTPERLQLLEDIGMTWAKSKDVFDTNYGKLCEFYHIVHHSKFPVKPFDEKIQTPTKAEQVNSAVDKLLQGRAVDPSDRAKLVELLSEQALSRWITSMRDEYKDWEKLKQLGFAIGTEEMEVSKRNKFEQWKERKKKLDQLQFEYIVLKRSGS